MKERKRTNKKYSPEFKVSVIIDMREDRLGYQETMRKYFPLDKQVENDLIVELQRLKEENQYLRAENEYIKKLSALIAAEEQKKSKKQK